MSFVAVGTITAMVTGPDPRWWEAHFSHLGTFWSVSGLMFNGALVVRASSSARGRSRARAPRTISTIVVFALNFGWISVFICFLGVADQSRTGDVAMLAA
jgi:hypothetical protein